MSPLLLCGRSGSAHVEEFLTEDRREPLCLFSLAWTYGPRLDSHSVVPRRLVNPVIAHRYIPSGQNRSSPHESPCNTPCVRGYSAWPERPSHQSVPSGDRWTGRVPAVHPLDTHADLFDEDLDDVADRPNAAIQTTADGVLSLRRVQSPDLPKCCGARENRTPDLLDANESRYQLRHSPLCR